MKITKAILTGGGRATRLQPITSTINKHLLPLANKPMIFHAIEKVVDAGITDIFINVNPGDTEFAKQVGDGGHWGIRITYFEQTGGPQGIAHVVNEAKKFIGDDPFVFYLSDNILLGSVKDMIREFENGKYDCMLALSQVPDPERFGVPIFSPEGTLVDVVEKPAKAPNHFAVTGIYVYGPKIFYEAFQHIKKSTRGEYEISDIHSYFLKNGKKVGYKEITGWWKDTGKPEDLLLANQLLLDMQPEQAWSRMGNIDSSAHIEGKVMIGQGTVIGPNSTIRGPVVIGEHAEIKNANIGPYVTLGRSTKVDGVTIANTMVFDQAVITGGASIADSLIGKAANLHLPKESGITKKLIVGDKTVIQDISSHT